jgi:hypothetical protein
MARGETDVLATSSSEAFVAFDSSKVQLVAVSLKDGTTRIVIDDVVEKGQGL